MPALRHIASVSFALLCARLGGACGGTSQSVSSSDAGADGASARGSEHVGQACQSASECFIGLEGGTVKGAVQCLDRVQGGYCTHLCQTDADCCAVAGECKTGFRQVCAPFESTGQNMCFLSCETADLHSVPADGGAEAGTATDDTAYCQYYVGSDFLCRSTGGGKNNRKVCVPGGTATDAGRD